MSVRVLGLAAVALAALPTWTSAQTTSWTSTAGGNWSAAGNWSNGVPNSATAVAQFDASASSYIVGVDGNFELQALRFLNAQTGAVTVRAAGAPLPRILTLTPSASGATTVFVESGSGDHTIGNPINTNTQLLLGGGSAGSPVNQVWEVQGSRTLTVGAQITATLGSGNTLTKQGTGTMVLPVSNSGNPLWTGGLTVAQGRVLANNAVNSTGTGPVTVATTATLGGHGRIVVGGANRVTIQDGGFLAPGTADATPVLTVIGTSTSGLTMDAGSALAVRLFGTGATEISRVDVDGDAVINTNQIQLDLSGVDADALRAAVGEGNSRTYTVLRATGTALTGSGFNAAGFTVVNLGNFAPGEFVFGQFQRFDQGTSEIDGFATILFTPVPVPEPRYALLLATLPAVYARLRSGRWWGFAPAGAKT